MTEPSSPRRATAEDYRFKSITGWANVCNEGEGASLILFWSEAEAASVSREHCRNGAPIFVEVRPAALPSTHDEATDAQTSNATRIERVGDVSERPDVDMRSDAGVLADRRSALNSTHDEAIRAEEREACARVAETYPTEQIVFWDRPGGPPGNGIRASTFTDVAAAIRARASSPRPVPAENAGRAPSPALIGWVDLLDTKRRQTAIFLPDPGPQRADGDGWYPVYLALLPPGTVAPEGWRPISTAPKDGTHVLALWPSKRRQAAFDTYWDSDQSQGDKPGWYAPGWGYLLDGYEPTGWMPHPAAPPSPPASETA